jgi:uroporphyrin-III C-methyltransferase / precorrin-2 dehydrogenase / sirohydrochlorin ferrochelatase
VPEQTSYALTPSPFQGVTLVGGGPGDPELLTIAGMRALLGADVVVTDRLGPVSLLPELGDVEVIDVGKTPYGPATSQEEINRILVEKGSAGLSVVRLKGGDNFVFGRGFEEVIDLRDAGVPIRVIPGVSSPIAVPGLGGVPITHRGVSHEFTIVSGHLAPSHPDSLVNWTALAAMSGTIVLMMAVVNGPAIADVLIRHGRAGSTPVAVVVDGSLPTQRVIRTTLADLGAVIAAEDVQPPAIFVIGAVAAL